MNAPRFARLLALVAIAGVAGAACIGSASRSELEKKVRDRGGGISQELVLDAVEALRDAQRTDSVGLVTVTATNNQVVLQARVPDRSEEYDVYSYGTSGLYGGDGLSDPQPGTRSPGDVPIEARMFSPDDVALDRLNDMLDTALAEAALDDGYLERVVIARPPTGGDVTVTVTVTNDRQSVDALFSADGTRIGGPAT